MQVNEIGLGTETSKLFWKKIDPLKILTVLQADITDDDKMKIIKTIV